MPNEILRSGVLSDRAPSPSAEIEGSGRDPITLSHGSRPELIHVLFFIDQLCESGGAERVLLNTIRLLPKDRFRCSLITFKFNPEVSLFQDLPCPHHVFPLRRTYDWNSIVVARKIRSFIRRENVKIVHTFHETSDLWAGFISKMSGAPVLISSRRDMGILRSTKHHVAYRMMSRMFDRVLTVSEQVRSYCMQQDHLPPGKVATLYNGIDLRSIPDRGGHWRSSLNLSPSAPVVIAVGHLRRVKGIDVLVETAANVAREVPEAVFLVAGRNNDQKHFGKVQARIEELGLQRNVLFLGETEHVLSLLGECDIFFLPSRSEGFSNALIQAMACSLPCVATRVGGNAEAIEEGRSGYLVENEDSRSAADRILDLVRDPKKAQQMGAVGRSIVEKRFTAQEMIRQLTKCYEQLLVKSGAA